jgi:thiol-disulfide isomerase/thioredoxin
MKKYIFALLLTLAVTTSVKADIQFQHGPWQEILAQAGKENKLIFVDAFTSWCGPCKWMAANTFTNDEVATFFNANFINAKIDMEKGEGPDLAETYNVRAYPTLLFVNAAGELVHFAIGALDAAQFLKLGKDVLDPNFASLAKMKKQFAAGETDREFLATYILSLKEVGESTEAALAKFRSGMSGAALLEDNNWKVFNALLNKLDSEEAQYFLAHLSDFAKKHGEEQVYYKALNMYSSGMIKAIYTGGTPAEYDAGKQILLNSGVKGAAYRALSYDLEWYKRQDDWDNYSKTAIEFVKQTPDIDPTGLNNLAWSFYEGVDDTKMLKTALKWITKACEQEPSYASLDTKAMLLYKLGRKDDAIVVAKAAIEAAKASGEPFEATQEALDMMLAE